MKEQFQNGYIIQMYQYARRYRYNYRDSIRYINYLSRNQSNVENASYMALGDFDMLEITLVKSFRKYHDLSNMAKRYLGRRQSILLYCIQDKNLPLRILYDSDQKCWYENNIKKKAHRFFCLSSLSITNEAHGKTEIFCMFQKIREKILHLTDMLNEILDDNEKIVCEVYGTLGATEIGIVWLCDQYVNILFLLDYLKHMKLQFDDGEKVPLFLAVNTTVAVKYDKNLFRNPDKQREIFKDVKGEVFTQISFHDELGERSEADGIVEKITNGESCKILYSAGEYDMIIHMPACRALQCVQEGQILNIVKRNEDGDCIEEPRKILRNNTQIVLERRSEEDNPSEVQKKIKEMSFCIEANSILPDMKTNAPIWEEWMELSDSDSDEIRKLFADGQVPVKSNFTYYNEIRMKMEHVFRSSTGAIDMLDLLYADYLSTVANAYSQIWVLDFHRQFKAVLYAINLWLDNQKGILECQATKDNQWDDYSALTNAFKQQIYHLTQTNRMALETPRCHFRVTSQYDLLIHAYYGFTKIILRAIYLLQGADNQSELVPLITVNTVPQVKSQLYFEYGNNDGMRAININIPAAIIFDMQRGFSYLVHELFHYAVPKSREKRNYLMGVFIISECLKMQFVHIFSYMLYTKVDGSVDVGLKTYFLQEVDTFGLSMFVRNLIFTDYIEGDKYFGKYWLDDVILQFLQQCADEWQDEHNVGRGRHDLCSEYQNKIFQYCQCEKSDHLFDKLCTYLMECIHKYYLKAFGNDKRETTLQNVKNKYSDCNNADIDKILDRLLYCITDEEFRTQQFSGLRKDYANTEKAKEITHFGLWKPLQEASCDLAMISLSAMRPDDYLLFCIQSWRDSNCGDFHPRKLEQEEWLRCTLVFNYCRTRKNIRIKDFKDGFIKKYVWFYTKSSDLETISRDGQERNRKVYKEAVDWWDMICKKIKDFNSSNKRNRLITYYDSIFAEVLADFDIESRIEKFSDADKKDALQSILKEVKETIFYGYESLISKLQLQSVQEPYVHVTWNALTVEDYAKGLFQHNLSIAWHFQRQQSFQELADFNLNIQKNQEQGEIWQPEADSVGEEGGISEYTWNFHARSLQELLFYLKHCECQLQKGDEKEAVWFRGQPDKSFLLVPSVMRKYDTDKFKKYASLRAYQQYEFEKFKYYADGASEMPRGVHFTISDYIALMQHYSIPTSLLDWSENAFSALYFALENYFELSDPEKKDVALYLLCPQRYNELYRQKTELNDSDTSDGSLDSWIQRHVPTPRDWLKESIPNLSTKKNEKIFNAYLLGKIKFDQKFTSYCKEQHEEECESITGYCMPVAIRTSRLNSRIRTQSGCFVAFNLYTLPQCDKFDIGEKNRAFDYISLEEIQKQMLRDAGLIEKSDAVFLYKITIDNSCCEDVRKWLRGMGISRSSVYPELELYKNRF